MSDSDAADEPADDADTGTDDLWARETAPQSPYTVRQVGIGLLVAFGCAIIAFGLPLALT